MGKNMKLNLNDIKVQSFITSLGVNQEGTILGGGETQPSVDYTYCDCPETWKAGCTDWLCGHTQVPTGNPCRVCD
jgi:hypothetical protein